MSPDEIDDTQELPQIPSESSATSPMLRKLLTEVETDGEIPKPKAAPKSALRVEEEKRADAVQRATGIALFVDRSNGIFSKKSLTDIPNDQYANLRELEARGYVSCVLSSPTLTAETPSSGAQIKVTVNNFNAVRNYAVGKPGAPFKQQSTPDR